MTEQVDSQGYQMSQSSGTNSRKSIVVVSVGTGQRETLLMEFDLSMDGCLRATGLGNCVSRARFEAAT